MEYKIRKMQNGSLVDRFNSILKEKNEGLGVSRLNTTPELIDILNNGVEPTKRRFTSSRLEDYNSIDDAILSISDQSGVSARLIKGILMHEGLKPVKNSKGYHGYAQSNQASIDSINKNLGTNYTLNDLYNINKATQYVADYIKYLDKVFGINKPEEVAIAYN